MDENLTYNNKGFKKHVFTNQTSPRLTFWLGAVCGALIVSFSFMGYIGYLYSGGAFQLKSSLPDVDDKLCIVNKSISEKIDKKASDITLGANDYYLGDTAAKTTLVLYTDFECQLCKLYQKNITEFVKAHADKVKLVTKNFVLQQKHPQAKAAAQAAICAGQQGKYYEMADKLYANQSNLSITYYNQAVSELGLDPDHFSACLTDASIGEKIDKDYEEGLSLGVSGIPNTIIIYPDNNLQIIDGNVSQEYLQSLLQSYL